MLTLEGVTGVDLKERCGEASGNDSLNHPGGPDWAATMGFSHTNEEITKKGDRRNLQCPHYGQGLRL